jgi:hypothetical protein
MGGHASSQSTHYTTVDACVYACACARGSSTRPRGRAGSRPTCRTPKSGSQRALHARPEAAAHGRRLSPDALQGPAPGQPINCGVMAGFGVCCCAPYVPCPCMMYVRACAGHTRLRTELASEESDLIFYFLLHTTCNVLLIS